jgi:hypothetical protein
MNVNDEPLEIPTGFRIQSGVRERGQPRASRKAANRSRSANTAS